MKHISNERGAVPVLAAILVALVVVVVGMAIYNVTLRTKGNKTASPSPVGGASSTPSPTASKTPVAVKTHVAVAGEIYTSKAEGISFKVPAGWTVKETGAPTESWPYDSAEISSPDGLRLWWVSASGGLGGGCDPNKNPHVFIHAVTPVPGVQGTYVVEAGPKDSTTLVGVVSRDRSPSEGVPQVGDTGVCLYYTTFKSRDGKRDMWLSAPDVVVATRAGMEGRKALTSGEIASVKTVMLSLTYK